MNRNESQPSICVIVPAFNEEASLPGVVGDLRQHTPDARILVIDDGSTDGTSQVAGQLNVRTIRLPFNLGIGGAVQTGLLFAQRNGFDIAVQFDGDGQHRADQIDNILEPILAGTADAVIGSRYLTSSAACSHPLKKVGTTLLRLLVSLVTGQKFSDTTSGFRAYHRRTLAYLAQVYPQDYPEPEAIVDLCRAGYKVVEVAVRMRSRATGRSSIGLRFSPYYMIKVMLATLIARVRNPITIEEDK